MLGLFKLKKKSKKDKEQNQDDEKENTSSPTKVKKVESKSKSKDSKSISKSKLSKQTDKNENTKNSQNFVKQNDTSFDQNLDTNPNNELCEDMKEMAEKVRHRSLRQKQQEKQQILSVETNVEQLKNNQSSPLSSKSVAVNINVQHPRAPVLSASDAHHQSTSFIRGVSLKKF